MSTLLIFGFVVPEEELQTLIREDAAPQVAANKLQWNLVAALESVGETDVRIISSVPASDFPKNRRLVFRTKAWQHAPESRDVLVGFVNLPVLKQLTRLINCISILWRLRKETRDEGQFGVLVYGLTSPFLVAAKLARKMGWGKLVVMVPDLPQYMRAASSMGVFRRAAKWLDGKIISGLCQDVDACIPLTEAIALEYFPGKPYVVIEGIAGEPGIHEIAAACSEEADPRQRFIVMYAGGLKEEYGIRILLEGFGIFEDDNARLIVCGAGPLAQECEDWSKRDPRIEFRGFLKNEEVKRIQGNATVLVNPRPSTSEFVKYSFPSKTIEYLASGKIVLTTKLPGIPADYNSHLVFIEDETPAGIADKFRKIASMPPAEKEQFGLRGREFVLTEKNVSTQGAKIVKFFEELGHLETTIGRSESAKS